MKQNYFSQQIVMLYHTFKDEQRNVKQPPKLQYEKQLAIQQFTHKFPFSEFWSKINHPLHPLQFYRPRIYETPVFN